MSCTVRVMGSLSVGRAIKDGSRAASLVIFGGIVAAIVGQQLLHSLGIRDWRVHGLATWVSGGGITAAQVTERNELGAAFAALGVGLNGLLKALLVPLSMLVWE